MGSAAENVWKMLFKKVCVCDMQYLRQKMFAHACAALGSAGRSGMAGRTQRQPALAARWGAVI